MESRKYKILDLVFIFSALLLSAYLVWQFWPSKTKWFENQSEQKETKQDLKSSYVDKVTGLPSNNVDDLNPRILAVMIENFPDVYPLSGLNEAKVVYEAPVEGGMSRFMAIYSSVQDIIKVGPVRSARPDYFDWAAEYGKPLYLHCGGSPEALKILLTDKDLSDLNEFYNSQYFWREATRVAPHNLYTSSYLWQKALIKNDVDISEWQTFTFGQNNTTTLAANLEAAYSDNTVVIWKYNSGANVYERYYNGEIMLDDEDKPITAQTIIVTKNKVKILDEVGRRAIYNIGSNDAYILSQGQVTTGTWKKSKAEFRTRFYDENGTELSVSPGKIWFMSVPEENEVKIF